MPIRPLSTFVSQGGNKSSQPRRVYIINCRPSSMIKVNLLNVPQSFPIWKPKKDIVRTYIPGDICPHNISLVRHISFVRCCADIVRIYISRDICLHNVRTISFFGFQLWRCSSGCRANGGKDHLGIKDKKIKAMDYYCSGQTNKVKKTTYFKLQPHEVLIQNSSF